MPPRNWIGSGLSWSAGRLAAITARLSYAGVEGLAYAFSRQAGLLIVGAELAVFVVRCGVRMPLRVAVGTFFAAGTLRAGHCLVMSFRHSGAWRVRQLEDLSSIWDWEPPGSDAKQSSAWHILRQLAVTANKLSEQNPAIHRLLDQPALAANELAMRLYFFFSAQDRPLLEPSDLTAAAAPAAEDESAAGGGGSEDGGSEGDAAPAVAAGCTAEAVPAELMEQLARYRGMACLSYDFDTDEGLSKQLSSRGYTLLCASHAADISNGCPAYFLAISEERKEALLAIRGTFSPEDAFLDLLATGAELGEGEGSGGGGGGGSCCSEAEAEEEEEAEVEGGRPSSGLAGGGHCHSGMGCAALFLGRKFGPVLRPLHDQGCSITLVGHSLGAGVASLLAVFLRRSYGLGPERLTCYAFEPPPCMDLELAQSCADVVTSTVHGDDLVPRLCTRSFAGLLEELAAFDWRQAQAAAAAEVAEKGEGGLQVAQHLEHLLVWALGGGGSGDKDSGRAKEQPAEGRSEAADGLLQAAAGKVRAGASGGEEEVVEEEEEEGGGGGPAGGSSSRRASLDSDGFEKPYNAHIPGRVVLIYRQGDGQAGGATGGAGGGGGSTAAASVALVDCQHPAVRRLRVSSRMITDHFVDTDDVVAALGG